MGDECEFCGGNAEYDVLVEGDYVRLCLNCLDKDRMVIVKKPSKIQIDDSFKRPTVKEILSRMSGVGVKTFNKKTAVPTLDQLRKPKESNEMKDRLSALANPSKPGTMILKKVEDKSISSENIKFNKENMQDEEFLDI